MALRSTGLWMLRLDVGGLCWEFKRLGGVRVKLAGVSGGS